MASRKDPCHHYACKLQTCLEQRKFTPEKCQHIINDMIECCKKWGKESLSCEGFMKNIEKENIKRDKEECVTIETIL